METDNTLREFSAILHHCDVLMTGNSLHYILELHLKNFSLFLHLCFRKSNCMDTALKLFLIFHVNVVICLIVIYGLAVTKEVACLKFCIL